MNYRNNYLNLLNGTNVEQFPKTEFMMFWPECDNIYLPKMNNQNYYQHFGLGTKAVMPVNFNPNPLYTEVILEETDSYILKTDALGVTCKIIKNSSAMPHYLDFPIKDKASFLKYAKRLNPDDETRIYNLLEFKKYAIENNMVTELVSRGPFAFLRDFINFNDLMIMFYDEPELVQEMTEFHADFLVRLWSKALDLYVPDQVCIGEDMAYKNTCMISPQMVEKFIYPAWKKIIDMLKSKGVKNIILDSDGNTMSILPIVIKAGFTAISPIERAAGMDGEEIRKLYPDLTLIGGVDKLQLAKEKQDIDNEIAKAVRLYKKGKYLPSCDHSVPPIVSYENYKYYIDTLQKEIDKL